MAHVKEIYKCEVCGNIFEVVHGGGSDLKCCGLPMTKMEEKEGPEGQEKHLPIIEKVDGNIICKVGSVPHPMENDHYIQWVELIFSNRVERIFLSPEQEPIVEFRCIGDEGIVKVRAYCNIHGLWVKK